MPSVPQVLSPPPRLNARFVFTFVSGNPSHQFELVRRKTTIALKSMSVAKLQDLRGKVDAAISEKLATRRRELETQLSELARHDPRGTRTSARGRGPLGPVASKFRNPQDSSPDLGRPRWRGDQRDRNGRGGRRGKCNRLHWSFPFSGYSGPTNRNHTYATHGDNVEVFNISQARL
jgi:hypothetical protein